VIKSFRCAETERLHRRQPSRRFQAIERIVRRRFGNRTARQNCETWRHRREIAWKPCSGNEEDSIAFESMINGVSVSFDRKGTRTMLRCGLPLGAFVANVQKRLSPIHPDEILRAEFMEPLRLSMNRLALDLHVPVTRIAEIVHERRGITPDTALRLARYFQTSARFWLNLQSAYDLEVAEDELSHCIEREVQPSASVAATARS
jgi:antitoxin HigA-1